jgi:hypothetical protein
VKFLAGCFDALHNVFQPWIPKWPAIWIADAHRGDGKRFVVRADELLTAFLELESAINQSKILAKDQNSCH